MPYFRYDDYASLVTELKSKKRLVTKRNKLLRECFNILEDITEHTDYNEQGIDRILEKIKKALGEKNISVENKENRNA